MIFSDYITLKINIDVVSKWFNMRKDHIKKTLTESYIKILIIKL